jgi:hypothetical protein
VENKIDLHTEFPIAMLRLAGSERTAAFPPFSKNGPPEQPVEGGGTSKRNIPKDHPYDPRSLKPMAKSLWAASVSLGHALTAYRHLSRLKSGTISPDGMLGGRGYVMGIADIRKKLYDACEALSAITDTLHDEIMAPHWKPRLAQLDAEEAEDVENYVEESQEILANPEDEAEEEADEIESHKPKAKGADDEDEKDEDEGSSELPGGGSPPEASAPQPMTPKMANSAWPTGVLPGGPRIVHLDRQDPDPNPPEAYPSDDWGTPTEKEYLYPTPFMGVTVQAESVVPDATTEDTPTEAWDFGLGYGAHGQGAGGYENPSDEGVGNKGVWGPHSGLPGTPPISSGDSTPELDYKTNEHLAQGLLPNDGQPPVARTDYFRGDRGNLINTQSTLPGESTPSGEFAPSLMNTDFTYEDVETPYVRYDYTTHDYRKDPLHAWPQKAEQDKEP